MNQESTEESQDKKRRRGIYLLPNLFTTAGLFAGFFAIVSAMNNNFMDAAIAIFIAMVMDGLDGRVARITNTQSDFGAEYDSLTDMVAFGLAPSLVLYEWALADLGKAGWLAAFIYVAGAALRLARFNTQVETSDKRYFQGLPSPAAAALLAGLVWVSVDYGVTSGDEMTTLLRNFAFILTMLAALLMVSNIRYHSFKELNLHGKVPFFTVLLIVLGFVLVSLDPAQVLFGLFFIYAISGLLLTLAGLRKWRNRGVQNK